MRFIAPPTAFRPYRVPCGPRSTSMRSRSRNRANTIAGRARYTPSRYIAELGSDPASRTFGTDPTDRELAPAGVLRKRHRGGQRRRPFDGLGSQAAEIGLRDGSDRDGSLLNIAPARLCGRDDRLFHEGDSQGEGHGDPFARPHAHGTTLPLEAAQFCGNLVVAFRKVLKREVARGARFPLARSGDTPNRHANAWQRGTGLVDDGTGQALPLTVRRAEAGAHNSARTAASNTFMLRMRGVSYHSSYRQRRKHRSQSAISSCLACRALAGHSQMPSVVADSNARRWRLCWCSVRRRAKLSPRSRQVLVLQSFDRGNLVVDYFTGNFRVDLDQRAGQTRERRSSRRRPDRVCRRA